MPPVILSPPPPLDYSVACTGLLDIDNTLAVPVPACVPGCLLVMTAVAGYPWSGSTVHPIPPAGWTVWQGATGARQGVWTKTATTADATAGAMVTQGFDGTAPLVAQITSYPPATVSKFVSETGSPSPDTSYSPVFPSGISQGQMVLYCAGARTSPSAADPTSGCAAFNLPGNPWSWHVPPIGPSFVNGTNTQILPALGTAAVMGAQGNPTVRSPMNLDHLAGFLVITPSWSTPDWLYVTASGSAGAGAGMALTVTALSGAGGGQQSTATAVNTVASGNFAYPAVAINPNFSGSLIYGAAFANNPAAAFTAQAGTTFSQNFFIPTVNPASHGTFRSSRTSSASQVMTVGGAGPYVGTGIDVAAAEIQGNGLAETGTAFRTAMVPGDYRHRTPSQTAILTSMPPSGTRLVATVTCGVQLYRAYLGSPVVTVSDSKKLAWTELARSNGTGYAGVWTAVVP